MIKSQKLLQHICSKECPETTCSVSTEVEEHGKKQKEKLKRKAKAREVLAFLIKFETALHIWQIL